MRAFAYRNGEIRFALSTPEGALEIAEAPVSELRCAIEATARLAYDNDTLLVPGVPEAEDGNAAVDALIAYKRRVVSTLNRKGDRQHAA